MGFAVVTADERVDAAGIRVARLQVLRRAAVTLAGQVSELGVL